jgi:hypothetical protein
VIEYTRELNKQLGFLDMDEDYEWIVPISLDSSGGRVFRLSWTNQYTDSRGKKERFGTFSFVDKVKNMFMRSKN